MKRQKQICIWLINPNPLNSSTSGPALFLLVMIRSLFFPSMCYSKQRLRVKQAPDWLP